MDFQKYANEIIALHPEFTEEEIIELCEEYVSKFNKKTKEESKIRSLEKWLKKEFMWNLPSIPSYQEGPKHWASPVRGGGPTLVGTERSYTDEGINSTPHLLSKIPKKYFQWNGDHKVGDWILRIQELNKQLGKTILFQDTSLGVKAGEKIALVGKNGSGKSTLLKIIIGKEELETWEIELAKHTKIWFLSQDIFWESQDRKVWEEMLTTLPQVTKNQERLLAIDTLLEKGDENAVELIEEQAELIEWMVNNDGYQKYALQVEILKYFWFSKEQENFSVGQLSWGEQTKLQIAKFLLQEVDFLILDEPTNHLDIEGIMFLEEFCKLWWKTLICISHDKKFLNAVFDQVIEINNKKLVKYQGNYDKFLEQKIKNYEIQHKNFVSQQKYLDQQEKFIEKFRYKSTKASQVQSRIKLLDKIDKIDEPEKLATEHRISFTLDERLPNLVMQLTQLNIGYEKGKSLITCPKVIEITKDMKIGIVGKNGIGKTTLIKTILNEIPALQGEIYLHQDMKIGSYSQTADELDREKSIIDEIVGPNISHKDARTLLGSLLISNEKMDQKIGTLSGGERAKVALTKMLLSKPHIIIMDEPTNHLDIDSKEVIKAMLEEFNGVSIIVSHDRDFLESVSNRLRVLHKGNLEIYHNTEKWFDNLEKILGKEKSDNVFQK